MKQKTKELVNWIKNACAYYSSINGGFDTKLKAIGFLDSFVDNGFVTKIPESLKKAVLNNDAEFYISFYYNSTTEELEKYIGVKKSDPPKVLEFYYHPDHLKQLDSDIYNYIYPESVSEDVK